MNENPDPGTPETEAELGQALGDALQAAPDDLVIPPPVASIADRAAAKARARTARRTVGSIAASVALVVGGAVAFNAGDDGEVDQEVAIESAEEAAPAATADVALQPEAETSEPAESTSVDPVDVDPAEISTGRTLDWIPVEGPAERSGSLMPTADGRIVAILWSETGVDSVVVTADGRTWEPIATPSGISPHIVELGEELWVTTGHDATNPEPVESIHVSDDQGTSWQQLDVPGVGETVGDGYVTTRSYVSGAVPFGDAVVVVSGSWTDLDVARLAVDQGIASSVDEVIGWGSAGGDGGIDTITIEVGEWSDPDGDGEEEPLDYQSFEFTPEELGLSADAVAALHGPGDERFTLSVIGVDGVRSSQEFAGSPSRLAHVGGTIVLSAWGHEGSSIVLSSTDGRTWTETPAPDGFELAGAVDGTVFGTDWSGPGFTVHRLAGGGLEEVAAFPELSQNTMLVAGPAGLAGTVHVAGSEFGLYPEVEPIPVDDVDAEPGVWASRDGIELRFEEDGTGVVIDTNTGEVLRTFTEDEMNADEPPAGVIEVDEPVFSLRIEDPETGEELVTFTAEDFGMFEEGVAIEPGGDLESRTYSEAGSEEFAGEDGYLPYPGYTPPVTWVGWSADGTTWGFESLTDAFGVSADAESWAQLAVGDGFVLALVEEYAVLAGPDDPEASGSTGGGVTTRWFLAEVG